MTINNNEESNVNNPIPSHNTECEEDHNTNSVPSWLLGPSKGHVVLSARRELRAEGYVWRYVIKPSERVSVGPLSSVKAVEVLTGDAGFGNFGIGVVGARGLLHAANSNQGRWISIETGEATS